MNLLALFCCVNFGISLCKWECGEGNILGRKSAQFLLLLSAIVSAQLSPVTMKVNTGFKLPKIIYLLKLNKPYLQSILKIINHLVFISSLFRHFVKSLVPLMVLKNLTHPRAFAHLPKFRRHFRGTQNSGFHR